MTQLISELLAGNAKKVISQIKGLSDEDLVAAVKAEEADKNRTTVITALVAEAVARKDPPEEQDAGGKAERGEQPEPAWKDPNYDGPLTCEQAHFRNTKLRMKTLRHRTGKKPVQFGG